ncbi:glycosyltransferase family 2 protein [Salinirubellus salinus]|uniref:Glycosyltransferase family 2 protein n=1 Tax=Salinirubellus salinus TaxID=1364945 RepID=A0A9E7R2W1_9EURY|nr:glycosyltransferase family 2 protein [Salinirubellus salinus]UWM54264.1 glycosyltransferase family 2 protein [Salinirubellus salinus]
MYEGQTVGVVVTAYNEEGLVGRVIETMPEFVDRVYAIDDGSTDGTWNEILEHADDVEVEGVETPSTDDPVPVPTTGEGMVTDGSGYATSVPFVLGIKHARNRGYGATVKTGYRHAHGDRMDVVAVMNGDGQMAPEELHRIIDPVVDGRADYAKGDRMRTRDTREGMSGFRFVGNAALTIMTKFASGYWKMNDSQNGYTAVSLETLERIPYESLYDEYGFLNDTLTTLNIHGMRVANVPHRAVYGEERSSIRLRRFVPRVSALLARNFVRRLKARYLVLDFHPAVLCYLFGTVGLLATLLATVAAVALPLTLVEGFFAAVLTTVLFVAAGTVLSVGIAFDVEQNHPLELVLTE